MFSYMITDVNLLCALTAELNQSYTRYPSWRGVAPRLRDVTGALSSSHGSCLTVLHRSTVHCHEKWLPRNVLHQYRTLFYLYRARYEESTIKCIYMLFLQRYN